MDALPGEKGGSGIRYTRGIPFVLRVAIDGGGIEESKKAKAEWGDALLRLEEIKRLAIDRGFVELAVCAYRAIAVIQDEYLNQPEQALQALDAGIALASDQAYLVEDQKGTVLYRQKKYQEAIGIWQRILPVWPVQPPIPDTLPLFACQRAGHCAGLANNWRL